MVHHGDRPGRAPSPGPRPRTHVAAAGPRPGDRARSDPRRGPRGRRHSSGRQAGQHHARTRRSCAPAGLRRVFAAAAIPRGRRVPPPHRRRGPLGDRRGPLRRHRRLQRSRDPRRHAGDGAQRPVLAGRDPLRDADRAPPLRPRQLLLSHHRQRRVPARAGRAGRRPAQGRLAEPVRAPAQHGRVPPTPRDLARSPPARPGRALPRRARTRGAGALHVAAPGAGHRCRRPPPRPQLRRRRGAGPGCHDPGRTVPRAVPRAVPRVAPRVGATAGAAARSPSPGPAPLTGTSSLAPADAPGPVAPPSGATEPDRRAAARRLLLRRGAKLQRCADLYDPALRRLTLRIEVDPKGSPGAVSLPGRPQSPLTLCPADALADLSFPPGTPSPLTHALPLRTRP